MLRSHGGGRGGLPECALLNMWSRAWRRRVRARERRGGECFIEFCFIPRVQATDVAPEVIASAPHPPASWAPIPAAGTVAGAAGTGAGAASMSTSLSSPIVAVKSFSMYVRASVCHTESARDRRGA